MIEQEDVQSTARKIPCIYIGGHPIRLAPDGRPYFDAQGKELVQMDIVPGDTLMMPETEVAGMTYWHDPRGVAASEFIGAGRRVKTEHADKSFEELQAIGYEFHDGRTDFLALPGPAQEASASLVAAPQRTETKPGRSAGPAATQAKVIPFVEKTGAEQSATEEVS